MKLTKEQIETAVKWWGDRVAAPKFDNGDPSPNGGMATMLAMLAAGTAPEPDARARFEAALTKSLSEYEGSEWGCSLDVDYHPSGMLADAAEAAGIPTTRFPWKTHMNFSYGGVEASCGYRAPYKTLLAKTVEA